jgi:hypothetical protein
MIDGHIVSQVTQRRRADRLERVVGRSANLENDHDRLGQANYPLASGVTADVTRPSDPGIMRPTPPATLINFRRPGFGTWHL